MDGYGYAESNVIGKNSRPSLSILCWDSEQLENTISWFHWTFFAGRPPWLHIAWRKWRLFLIVNVHIKLVYTTNDMINYKYIKTYVHIYIMNINMRMRVRLRNIFTCICHKKTNFVLCGYRDFDQAQSCPVPHFIKWFNFNPSMDK